MLATFTHIVKTQFLGLVALLLVLTGGAAYAAVAAKNSVVSRSIKDGQVKTVDLQDSAVSGRKIAGASVGGRHLVDGSVTSADVADGSLTGADVADGSISGADIADGAVAGPDVSDETLSGADVANDSLTGADVNESLLGTVPYAEQAGTGRYAYTGSCDPESNGYVVCSQLSITLARPGRILVMATAVGQTEHDSDHMSGSCQLYVDGQVYSTSYTEFEAHDEGEALVSFVEDNASIVAVTDVLSSGAHFPEVRCNQWGFGAIVYPRVRMTAVTLGAG